MNRTYIIMLAMLTMSLPLAAQTTSSTDASFLSGDQKLVRMAVDSSICILRQEYTLTDRRGNEYGRNGRSYFGRTYTIGVLAAGRIWTDSRIRRPWDMDANYEKFKAVDSIRPRLSETSARQVVRSGYTAVKEDSSSRKEDSSSRKEYNTSREKDSALAVYRSPDSLSDIALINDCRDRGGWLVVVATREPIGMSDTLPVSYTIYKAQPQFTATGVKGYLKNMPVRENVIGGVYFLSSTRLGKITFAAGGILGKDKEGWYIQLFPAGEEHRQADDMTPLRNLNNLR